MLSVESAMVVKVVGLS